jgi:hypothetical protein
MVPILYSLLTGTNEHFALSSSHRDNQADVKDAKKPTQG